MDESLRHARRRIFTVLEISFAVFAIVLLGTIATLMIYGTVQIMTGQGND